MAYPNLSGINQAVNALQADPAQIYAFAAEKARLPFNSSDLNAFMQEVQGWFNSQIVSVKWDGAMTIQDVLSYIEDNTGLPSTRDQFATWTQVKGFISGATGIFQRVNYPRPGQFYPPRGGTMDPDGTTYNITPISSGSGTVGTAPVANGQTTTGSAPAPIGQGFGGAFSNLSQWVSQHPLEIAGGFAAYLIATGKIRL